jgi:hypothetical protein
MAKLDEIAEHSEVLARELSGYGLDTRPYLRAPFASEFFTANIDTRQIRTWPGTADVQVIGDAKRRQVVLNVTENTRQLTRRYDVPRRGLGDDQVLSLFPIIIPQAKLVGYEVVGPDYGLSFGVTVEATVRAPKTSSSLLMGFDEVRQFIAMLPRRAKSVDDAHAALRPAVSKAAIRQGEWFFDPVTPDEAEAIRRTLSGRRMAITTPLEPGSSHTAVVLAVGNARYATGVVRDRRVKHHRPLTLEGWYRVVRNTEMTQPVQTGGLRRRSWD